MREIHPPQQNYCFHAQGAKVSPGLRRKFPIRQSFPHETRAIVNAEASKNIEGLLDNPLPIFGYSDREFNILKGDEGSAFKAYGDIILKDPGLVLHALQQLAPTSGKSSRIEINSINQVTMLLGAERLGKLTDGLPHMENTLQGMARAGYARTACRAYHAAFQAWDWAHIKNDHNPEEIFLATLLHDVAELALWVNQPEKIHYLRKLIFKDHLHTDEAQYLALGESLEHFSRKIAVNWNLPPLVHDSLRPENANNSRIQGVMLAIQLGRAAERGWHSKKMLITLELIAEYLDASVEETSSHIHNNAVRAARDSGFYGSRPAAALLPLLAGDDHILINDEFPTKDANTNVSVVAIKPTEEKPQTAKTEETSLATESKEPPATNKNTANEICISPQVDIFRECVENLQQGFGKMDLNEIMRTTVHGLHDGVGLNRVVFTMLTPNSQTLVSRFIVGTDNDPHFSRFHINLSKPNLFNKLMQKQTSLWVSNNNRDKLWNRIPEEFKGIIKNKSFYAMSIVIGNKPVGLFYADRRSSECQLDENSYKLFRQLCHVASKSFAALLAKQD